MSGPITAEEMADRLEALCIGGSAGLPRRERDLQTLLASATLWMEPDSAYREAEVNEGLRRWLVYGCPALQIDVVTLRRLLVDHRYLDRDDAGRHYSPGPGPSRWRFAENVAMVDPVLVVGRALSSREARKIAHERGDEE